MSKQNLSEMFVRRKAYALSAALKTPIMFLEPTADDGFGSCPLFPGQWTVSVHESGVTYTGYYVMHESYLNYSVTFNNKRVTLPLYTEERIDDLLTKFDIYVY